MPDRLQPGRKYRVRRGPYRGAIVELSPHQTPENFHDEVIVLEVRDDGHRGHGFQIPPDAVEPWDDGPVGVREPRRPSPESPTATETLPEPGG